MRPQILLETFLVWLSVPVGTKAVPQSSGSPRVTKTAPTTCPVTLPSPSFLLIAWFLPQEMAGSAHEPVGAKTVK